MTRPRLPNDVSRCHDDRCPWRMDCLRWIERKTGRVSQATLRESPDATECKDFRAAAAATLDAKETSNVL